MFNRTYPAKADRPANEVPLPPPVFREPVPGDPGVDVELTIGHTARGPTLTVSGLRPADVPGVMAGACRRETYAYASLAVLGTIFVVLTVGAILFGGLPAGIVALLSLCVACRVPGVVEAVAASLQRI